MRGGDPPAFSGMALPAARLCKIPGRGIPLRALAPEAASVWFKAGYPGRNGVAALDNPSAW